MAGRGRPQKTVAELKESGTYRPSRHGDRPEAQPPADAPLPDAVSPKQVSAPGNLEAAGQTLWYTILDSGRVTEADIPLLLEAFEWYAAYRDALGQFQQDVSNSRLRMASNTSYQNFISTLQQIGVTPAMLKKGSRPVESISAEEQHCLDLEKHGRKDLADETRACGYDPIIWVRWRHGICDQQGNDFPREQVLASEYDQAVQNGWANRVRILKSQPEFETYKHLTTE